MRHGFLLLGLITFLLTWQSRSRAAPDARRWEETTTFLRREQAAATFDSVRGRIVLFGGILNKVPVDETWEWTGEAWLRVRPASSPKARAGHAMAFDEKRARTVLFGGFDKDGAGLNDTWEWDGVNWVEASMTATPSARASHSMAFDAKRGMVLIFGGNECVKSSVHVNGCGFDGTWVRFSDMWGWNGKSWKTLSSAVHPPARTNAGLVYDRKRDRLVLFGGEGEASTLADTWEWNGTEWSEAASPAASPQGRRSHSMVYDEAREITLLVGGQQDATPSLPTTVWKWTGSAWTMMFGPNPPGRAGAMLIYDRWNSKSLLLGGRGSNTQPLPPDLWEWDGKWSQTSTVPAGRFCAASTYDRARGRVVMFGGNGLSRLFQDTWEWDGMAWHRTAPAHRPAARTEHAIAYDPERGVTVLFGGVNYLTSGGEELFNDTWEWNGTDWNLVNPPVSPPERSDHKMFYDDLSHRIVIYGGMGLFDAWAWDGSVWTKLDSPNGPKIWWGGNMAYDRARQRGVALTYSRQTWELAGAAWLQIFPAKSPSSTSGFAAAYDDVHRRTYFFAGLSDSDTMLSSALWAWDGNVWSSASPPVSPPPRTLATMAFDELRGRLVVFGGDARDYSGFTPPTFVSGGSNDEEPGLLADTWEYSEEGGYCAQTSQCASGNCVDGVCCDEPTCAPFACGPSGPCLTACTSRTDCITGAECDPAGKCFFPKQSSHDPGCSCDVAGPRETAPAVCGWTLAVLAWVRRRRPGSQGTSFEVGASRQRWLRR